MQVQEEHKIKPETAIEQNHCYPLPYLDLATDLLPNEEWVDIYGGYYSISNLGRVRSNDRLDTKGRKVKGKFRKQMVKHNHLKYPNRKTDSKELFVVFCFDGKKKTHLIKPLIGELFIGAKNKHQCYSLKNGVWNDYRAENIEIKSFSDSLKTAYYNGRLTRTTKFLYKNMETGVKYSKSELESHDYYSYNTVVQAAKQKIVRYGTLWKRVKGSV